ncbi:MAG: GyrI-like domain-containing protein [Planctomycetota bacterium]
MESHVKPDTRRRILDATLAAEKDFSAELTVPMLAEIAGMSDKHFQRAFQAVIGESPKSYLRRVRLQYAAYCLVWSEASVDEIARTFGFLTHAGFTKAFRRHYGTSPKNFRDNKAAVPYMRLKGRDSSSAIARQLASDKLSVRLETTLERRVAVVRHVGATETLHHAWQKLLRWAKPKKLVHEHSIFIGIHHDYWDESSEDRYRYDAALVIPTDFDVQGEVNTQVLCGGLVAATEFHGKMQEAEETWRYFMDQWLPSSGYQLRKSYVFDRYPYWLVQQSFLGLLKLQMGRIQASFCIPISDTPT